MAAWEEKKTDTNADFANTVYAVRIAMGDLEG